MAGGSAFCPRVESVIDTVAFGLRTACADSYRVKLPPLLRMPIPGLPAVSRAVWLLLYLLLRASGESLLTAHIERTFGLAAELADLVEAADDFELAEESNLSVVCFRHLPDGEDAADDAGRDALDVHQDALQSALQLSGSSFLTTTRLRGRTWLRAGILNHTATVADLDILLDDIRDLSAGF